MIRDVAERPSNSRIGPPEKLLIRKTESVFVGYKPDRLQLQWTGSLTAVSPAIVVMDAALELATNIF
jgi:hypothetical protein